MVREKNAYAVHSVEKAFDLINILADDPSDHSLQSLAERLQLSRNRLFRLLATLEERGMVEKTSGSGSYRLGFSAIELAQKCLKNVSLIQHAHPVMEELVKKHDEALYMAVILDDQVLFLDMVDCTQHIKVEPLVGKRFPFFTNAAGKVIRALQSRDTLDRFFSRRSKHDDLPDQTLLESELNAIRSSGVAVDNGGFGDGVIDVAVAVRDYAGKVIGALTMLGPSFRMLGDRLENEIIPSLRDGAEILSMKFGYIRS